MSERIYHVFLKHTSTGAIVMQEFCNTRAEAEVFARDFLRFEKYGNIVYISMEKI